MGCANVFQCRGRFIRLKHENKVPDNALAETITKPSKWTAEQDAELIRLVGETGNQWQKISQAMGGTHGNNQVCIGSFSFSLSVFESPSFSASSSSSWLNHADF